MAPQHIDKKDEQDGPRRHHLAEAYSSVANPGQGGYSLSDNIIREIRDYIEDGHVSRIQDICSALENEDIAEMLSKIDEDRRYQLINMLGENLDAEVFSYLENEIRVSVLERMELPRVAAVVNDLDSDDALSLIEDLSPDHQKDILRSLSRTTRAVVEEGLNFPEDSAGRLMQREMVAIPRFWTVGKTLDYLRAANHALPQEFYDIFVVDPMHHVVGEVSLSRLLCAKRSTKIEELMIDGKLHTVPFETDQEDVSFLFRKYGLVSAPVVDNDQRLIGVITIDDIVDVIDEEAEEDFLKLAGVTQSSDIYRAVFDTAKSRFSWLAVNLLTAIAASLVIGMFEETIDQLVALAILMPIVASMGGNAGTQSLTVAVRALAMKELSSANAVRIVFKEVMVGVINGFLFALIMGAIAWMWFSNPVLGLVIGMAMIINLIVAGFAGVVIPLALEKMGLDPALSSAVFLTTITDVLGFFAFLGFAAWILL